MIVTGYLIYMKEQGNFHAITPGEAYRSALLDRDELEKYIDKYQIKSILNLRGEDMQGRWHTDEIQIGIERGLRHYDVSISAIHEPSSDNVKRIMDIFAKAPRPILIHCQSGADRSGLVAAMWKVVVDKEPKDKAARQLSLRYGHIPWGSTAAMDKFFWKWTP